MVPAGSVLTYQAKGTTGYFQSVDDIAAQIKTDLLQSNVTVKDYTGAILGVVGSVDAYLGGPASFQLTMTLQTNADFGAVADVGAIADHSIYSYTGNMPVSTMPNVTIPGSAPASTGQPAQTLAGTASAAGDWFSNLFQSGVNSFALLMVGVILAVVLIIAGKQKGMAVL